jgi:hypothetical protein
VAVVAVEQPQAVRVVLVVAVMETRRVLEAQAQRIVAVAVAVQEQAQTAAQVVLASSLFVRSPTM